MLGADSNVKALPGTDWRSVWSTEAQFLTVVNAEKKDQPLAHPRAADTIETLWRIFVPLPLTQTEFYFACKEISLVPIKRSVWSP